MNVISAENLTKRFEEVTAVNGLSVRVEEGEFFGFLGPNGAGKTTTINMLTGLARPDAGMVEIAGVDCSRNPKAAQHLIGVVPDESNLYPELTGLENLVFCGALYGMRGKSLESRAGQLLAEVGLEKAGKRKFGGYSRGMKRRLTIAAGMVHSPGILFLDEPTTGIDVESARSIRDMLAALNSSGTTVFLTTHYIEEAERLCHRIAFIVKGRIVRLDSVENLLAPVRDRHELIIVLRGFRSETISDLSQEFHGLSFEMRRADELRVISERPFAIASLVAYLEALGTRVLEARIHRPSLEDVFVTVTGIGGEAMK